MNNFVNNDFWTRHYESVTQSIEIISKRLPRCTNCHLQRKLRKEQFQNLKKLRFKELSMLQKSVDKPWNKF